MFRKTSPPAEKLTTSTYSASKTRMFNKLLHNESRHVHTICAQRKPTCSHKAIVHKRNNTEATSENTCTRKKQDKCPSTAKHNSKHVSSTFERQILVTRLLTSYRVGVISHRQCETIVLKSRSGTIFARKEETNEECGVVAICFMSRSVRNVVSTLWCKQT